MGIRDLASLKNLTKNLLHRLVHLRNRDSQDIRRFTLRRKIGIPPQKIVIPPLKNVIPPLKNVIPSLKIVIPSLKIVIPSLKIVIPPLKNMIPLLKIVIPLPDSGVSWPDRAPFSPKIKKVPVHRDHLTATRLASALRTEG